MTILCCVCLQLFVMDLPSHKIIPIPMLKSSDRSQPAECPCGIHSIAINPSQSLLATGAQNTNDLAIYSLPTFDPVAIGEVRPWRLSMPSKSLALHPELINFLFGMEDIGIVLAAFTNLRRHISFGWRKIKTSWRWTRNVWRLVSSKYYLMLKKFDKISCVAKYSFVKAASDECCCKLSI